MVLNHGRNLRQLVFCVDVLNRKQTYLKIVFFRNDFYTMVKSWTLSAVLLFWYRVINKFQPSVQRIYETQLLNQYGYQ